MTGQSHDRHRNKKAKTAEADGFDTRKSLFSMRLAPSVRDLAELMRDGKREGKNFEVEKGAGIHSKGGRVQLQKERITVRTLQESLNELYKGDKDYTRLNPDGKFGGGTKTELELFQANAGISITGKFDEKTAVALADALDAKHRNEKVSVPQQANLPPVKRPVATVPRVERASDDGSKGLTSVAPHNVPVQQQPQRQPIRQEQPAPRNLPQEQQQPVRQEQSQERQQSTPQVSPQQIAQMRDSLNVVGEQVTAYARMPDSDPKKQANYQYLKDNFFVPYLASQGSRPIDFDSRLKNEGHAGVANVFGAIIKASLDGLNRLEGR